MYEARPTLSQAIRVPGLLRVLLLSVVLAPSAALAAQTKPAPDSAQTAPVRLFVHCQDVVCDYDFFRTEISFVSHVRDRRDADVHVLIAALPTAEGGSEVTLTFIGQQLFDGLEDTLKYVSRPAASADQFRQGLATVLKRGLVRYVSRTAMADDLTIVYTPSAAPASVRAEDRWNFWTFSATVNGYVNGEETLHSTSVGGSISANRVTDNWKMNGSIQTQYNSTTFDFGSGRSLLSIQRSHGMTALVVRSLNEHLSMGTRASATSSSFLNQDLTLRLAPALEFNLFPYRESTRRMFTIEYSVGATAFKYVEETIFGKLSETLYDHQVVMALRLKQPWGSVGLAAEGSHYLQDHRKHRATVVGNADWNVAKGLSLLGLVSFARVRDQIYLAARGASDEEILLRQRQLATSYSYSASFGISYTFGSPYANVVNRRFAGSMAGTSFVQ